MAKHPHDGYDHKVIEVYEELTGNDWEDAEEDQSGCYFARDKWVSCASIAEALKEIADYYNQR